MRGAGAVPVAVRSAAAFESALAGVDRVIVDLSARAYDGIGAIGAATAAGRPVLAVGQHDDPDMRKRALAAGAGRVYAYRRLFEDGPRQIGVWLAAAHAPESTP